MEPLDRMREFVGYTGSRPHSVQRPPPDCEGGVGNDCGCFFARFDFVRRKSFDVAPASDMRDDIRGNLKRRNAPFVRQPPLQKTRDLVDGHTGLEKLVRPAVGPVSSPLLQHLVEFADDEGLGCVSLVSAETSAAHRYAAASGRTIRNRCSSPTSC